MPRALSETILVGSSDARYATNEANYCLVRCPVSLKVTGQLDLFEHPLYPAAQLTLGL